MEREEWTGGQKKTRGLQNGKGRVDRRTEKNKLVFKNRMEEMARRRIQLRWTILGVGWNVLNAVVNLPQALLLF